MRCGFESTKNIRVVCIVTLNQLTTEGYDTMLVRQVQENDTFLPEMELVFPFPQVKSFISLGRFNLLPEDGYVSYESREDRLTICKPDGYDFIVYDLKTWKRNCKVWEDVGWKLDLDKARKYSVVSINHNIDYL
jgi:hypothetical protein